MSTVKHEVLSRSWKREATGFHDVTGRELHTGDVVEFFVDEFSGMSVDRADDRQTRMVDVVERIDRDFYAVCHEVGGALLLHRLNHDCRWLGTVRDNPELLHAVVSGAISEGEQR